MVAYLRFAAVAALLCVAQAMMDDDSWLTPYYRRSVISEVGAAAWEHHSVPCNPDVVGSTAACFNAGIPAVGNIDYHWGAPEIAYPTTGEPWGVHLTGPYPDGRSYLVSWYTGAATVGANLTKPDTSSMKAYATAKSSKGHTLKFTGSVITYMRVYTLPELANATYLSPYIHHVVLKNLEPFTSYNYQVSDMSGKLVGSYKFKTLVTRDSKDIYPLKIGLMADVGQSVNTSDTRDHLIANKPRVVIHVGDNTYADVYGASNPDTHDGKGTNQQRWDSHAQLWQPLMSTVPVLNCAANHELETSYIAASINYNTSTFSFPTNYPFQSYSARFPVPGTTSKFGEITPNLYYSTVIGGVVKLITLSNYSPFQPGSPQHTWAMKEFAAVDRKKTPWLFVQFHAPPYHTYYVHYKEMECFMSVYEDVFYQYGVDIVLNGHVHAYERTHPMYKYKPDSCGPMYIVIGDGGNVEGPYRNFVDEINPATNKTYCESLAYNGVGPVAMAASNPSGWGPGYQRAAHAPNCPTLSFQPAGSVGGGPVLVPSNMTKPGDAPMGFCQSSQPVWSAYRDPSFGHAILELLSHSTAHFKWYKNMEGSAMVMDDVVLERLDACPNKAGPVKGGRRLLHAE
ncbi:Purple acid phosphatase 15 [Tetrabaena socialis]|uniref:Purple acid phosphatase n=1 Tax=Tetrabaena socialis TaxID=47790 RepID=A0A2J8AAB8_9CHLO|nr:Purple acid phosphatase 15 [Tetrabaena socialis]|eukprot:PNH09476.1 Purple acid phosphatase 15 [Tetrabaena socialis]